MSTSMSRNPLPETPSGEPLPIEALRSDCLAALDEGPVVVSSPTGSGKSTGVPRWCPGRVLVVEPRRVACRALAQRVAALDGSPLGETVGYRVRDEQRARSTTRILFVTPGIALRMADEWAAWDTLILDEFHERSLDVDLLLALWQRRGLRRLVVMSATLEGERVAAHLGGRHLRAEGRQFPVGTQYLPGKVLLPEVRGLEERLRAALALCRDVPGDVLVFLPGKGEIRSAAAALGGFPGLDLLELHGGLDLGQQSRVFEPTRGRKVVLATNVAETSLTVPGIGVVIDSGLVRRTRYHRDRGFLTLVPVARDSADQRSGRAGRTAAGHCIRLWSEAAQLETMTPPEIHRESLVPLVLAAAACGERADTLPFLDPPRDHALEIASETLRRLDALETDGSASPRGRRLFGLPLDPFLGRLLVEAEGRVGAGEDPSLLDDMIDLVSTLGVERPLLAGGLGEAELAELEAGRDGADPLASACDAVLSIRALRDGDGWGRRAHGGALREARAIRRRLGKLFGRSSSTELGIDRRRLALAVLAADRRAAHVARHRKRRVAWSNGGTEIELGRDSAAGQLLEPHPGRRTDPLEAIAVLDTRALGLGGRETRIVATRVMPLRLEWLRQAGLGRDRLAEPRLEGETVVARIERVYARRVLDTREEVPTGRLARQAMARLLVAGRLFAPAVDEAGQRLAALRLARRLAGGSRGDWRPALDAVCAEGLGPFDGQIPELEHFVETRLETLGVESGEDLALLSADDFLPPELPWEIARELDRAFPTELVLPGATYAVEYDLARGEAVLHQQGGRKRLVPSPTQLPRLEGLRVVLRHKGASQVVREGR